MHFFISGFLEDESALSLFPQSQLLLIVERLEIYGSGLNGESMYIQSDLMCLFSKMPACNHRQIAI
jgi:hypothetical protein